MAWQNSQRAYRWRCVPIAWAWWRAPRGPRGGEAGGGRGMPRDGTEPVARAPRAFSSLHSSYFTLHKFTVVFCHSERRLLWRWDEKRTIDKVCLYVAVADNKCCVHFHLCECYDPYLFVCFFWLPPHGSAITFKLTLYFETMERCSYGFYTKRYFILFLKAFFTLKLRISVVVCVACGWVVGWGVIFVITVSVQWFNRSADVAGGKFTSAQILLTL